MEHGIEPERLVVLHPGAQLPSRRWPPARFAQVADALSEQGWQIAITGTSHEADITAAVLGAMTAPALHLAGATSLRSDDGVAPGVRTNSVSRRLR